VDGDDVAEVQVRDRPVGRAGAVDHRVGVDRGDQLVELVLGRRGEVDDVVDAGPGGPAGADGLHAVGVERVADVPAEEAAGAEDENARGHPASLERTAPRRVRGCGQLRCVINKNE
jgi:hypothetical protein